MLHRSTRPYGLKESSAFRCERSQHAAGGKELCIDRSIGKAYPAIHNRDRSRTAGTEQVGVVCQGLAHPGCRFEGLEGVVDVGLGAHLKNFDRRTTVSLLSLCLSPTSSSSLSFPSRNISRGLRTASRLPSLAFRRLQLPAPPRAPEQVSALQRVSTPTTAFWARYVRF